MAEQSSAPATNSVATSNDSINVNESTAKNPEPIEVQGGNGVTSFDELEALANLKTSPEPKKEKQAKEETKKDLKDKENEEKTKEAKETEKVSTKPLSKEGADKDPQTKPKSYKVKSGDSELDLLGDAELTVTIDGKPAKTTVQELLNNYSGKTAWDKKFSELDKDRKAYQKDKEVIQKTLDTFHDLAVNKKNPQDAINFLGEIVGADMNKFWDDFTAEMLPHFEKMSQMTPEEREKIQLQQKLERYQKTEALSKQKAEQAKAYTEMETRVKGLQEKLGIDQQTFYKYYEDLRQTGKIKEEDLTPELVAEYYEEVTSRGNLETLMTSISPDLDPTLKEQAIDDLRELMEKHPGLSDKDLQEIAVEVWGNKAAKNLSRKLKKTAPANTATPSRQDRDDPWSFDHLTD